MRAVIKPINFGKQIKMLKWVWPEVKGTKYHLIDLNKLFGEELRSLCGQVYINMQINKLVYDGDRAESKCRVCQQVCARHYGEQ